MNYLQKLIDLKNKSICNTT